MKKKILCLVILSIVVVAWFWPSRKLHVLLPIKFSAGNLPLTEIEIEGKTHLLEVDLGSKFAMTLRKGILEAINQKTFSGVGEWKDAQGNQYEAPSYWIPEIKIGQHICKKVTIQQEDDRYHSNTTLWSEEGQERLTGQGSIGLPLLKEHNLLLDLRRRIILQSDDKERLLQEGYHLDQFTKIPFELSKRGIILQATTDVGPGRFLLDTGSTLNLINSSLVKEQKCRKEKHGISFYTTSLTIGNRNFGMVDLHLYAISPELKIDGFLGSSFLVNHVVYIDFCKGLVYIEN